MITFRPFRAIRPSAKYAQSVASRPYDVLNSSEAKDEAAGNEHSFLRVIKPEIDLRIQPTFMMMLSTILVKKLSLK